ncbi:MAG TPA: ribbon-helix-helix domain-containing protein [Desulfosporosinus sp.]|nr:ribbon-helix-helix domain-containing protein [Desulfosporosinus sp.]
MSDKKSITLSLDTETIERLDKICKHTDMNRSQLIRALVSGDNHRIGLIFDTAKKLHTLF